MGNKNVIAVISLLVPVAGVIIFFVQVNKDKQLAVWALIWSMAGLAVALVVLMALMRYL